MVLHLRNFSVNLNSQILTEVKADKPEII